MAAVTLLVAGAYALAAGCSDSKVTIGGGSGDGAASGVGGNGQGGQTASAGGGTGSGGGATGSGGSGGVIDPGCASDGDCSADPAKPYCDVDSGDCVACLPTNDPCPQGQYCNAQNFQCAVGCADDSDCNGLFCNTMNHACVGCVADANCPAGSICIAQTCIPGCSPQHACQVGASCCGSICVDLATNLGNCGSCNAPCDDLDNAQELCTNGQCQLGPCDQYYADCNGDPADGCERNTLQDGPCVCTAGTTQSCYLGAPGTVGVGPCKAGTQTCNPDGLGWSACTGQVMPVSEVCGNAIDDDCNGQVDDGSDSDGDGWTTCGGDCCDVPGGGCSSPALVNPGAFEVLNNGLDDDCNPATSDVVAPPECSSAQKFATVTATDVANAMDICQTTVANPLTPQQKTWGLISASMLLANGNAPAANVLSTMQNTQTAILVNYGTVVVPQVGSTMAGISTGRMRDQLDAGYGIPDGGGSWFNLSTPPAAYLAAHNNALPSSAGCAGNCTSGSGANDSVNIKLTLRVPTNAKSFSYQFKFYSAEFPEWQCTSYNDFYLALLTSGAQGIPADKNISFDGLGNVFSVNNGFFDVCTAAGCNTCPDGPSELACTGMQGPSMPCVGALGSSGVGGGSKWLITDSPVVPGEVMSLELMTFDVGDSAYDTNVLLDNFHWNLTTATVSTHQ